MCDMHTEHLWSIPTAPLSVSNAIVVVGEQRGVAVRHVMLLKNGVGDGGDSKAKGSHHRDNSLVGSPSDGTAPSEPPSGVVVS
jgi:hypothetical protein